jgi:thiamine-phosphate pyrophosphorylase
VLSYYITDRTQFAGTEAERRAQLFRTIREAAAAGVDYIQLREKDLCVRELELLARAALHVIRAEGPARLLINHRTDVALAVCADGVHLTSSDIAASDARALTSKAGAGQFLVASSCHSAREVRLAEAHGADFAVLAPIFEKAGASSNGIGLEELRRATRKDRTPDTRVEAGDTRRRFAVFALGGIDLEHARECGLAGAVGIAGIRLFQQRDFVAALRTIRSL